FFSILDMFSRMFCFGIRIDWKQVSAMLNPEGASYVALPPYPFQRKRYFRRRPEKKSKGASLMGAAENDADVMQVLQEQNALLKEQIDLFKTYVQTNQTTQPTKTHDHDMVQEEHIDTTAVQSHFFD